MPQFINIIKTEWEMKAWEQKSTGKEYIKLQVPLSPLQEASKLRK